MALVESAVEAVELDAFAKEIPDLVFHGTTAYSMFKNSIFMALMTIMVSPAATEAPSATAISRTVPAMGLSTASQPSGTGRDGAAGAGGAGKSWLRV